MSNPIIANQPQSQALEIMGMKVHNFQEAINMAEYFSKTDLVPKDYKGKGGNIVVAWQKGLEIGLKPLQALSTIAIINGRATIWGDGLIALVKNSSKEEWTHETITGEGDNMVATCETKRASQEKTIKRSFSVMDAKKAGLWSSNVWGKYPTRMLQMRARGLCLRDAYPDVLNGLEIAEEIRDLQHNQIKEAQSAPKSLAQLGLETIEKDGFMIAKGDTYGKTDALKGLGFEYRDGQWCKELPKEDKVIEAELEEPTPVANSTEPPKKASPAKQLMDTLLEKGIAKDRVGEFVKDVLGLSSKDTDGITAVLSDISALDVMIKDFLAEPVVDIEDVF